MTDNRADNPRFAFIPKSAWDLLLDFAPIPLASFAIWYSVMFVETLVYIRYLTTFKIGPLAYAVGPHNLVPTTFACAAVIYFVLATILRRRERARGMSCEGFGRSYMLMFSGSLFILLLLTFWCVDAQLTPWPAAAPAAQLEWCAANSIFLGGAWAAGVVTAFVLRRVGKRFDIICLLPPVACILAMLGIALAHVPAAQVAQEVVRMFRVGRHYFSYSEPIFLVAIVLTACILPTIFWAERRLFQSSRRAVGIACAGLWVFATAMSDRWLWMVTDWLKQHFYISPLLPHGCWHIDSPFEPYFAIGIAGAFALAACVRAWVFSRRRDAMAAAKPADD
jgi:hypothetical protein